MPPSSTRALLLALALTPAAVAPGPATASAGDRADDRAVRYVVTLLEREAPRLAVDLDVPADPDGVTRLTFGDGWGGVSASGEDFELAGAQGADGAELSCELEREAAPGSGRRWSVSSAGAARVVARFVIGRTDHRREPRGSQHYLPIVEPGLVHWVGGNALPTAAHLDGREGRPVSLEWRGFEEAGWTIASSHGDGPGPLRAELGLDEFRHATFLAGDWDLLERSVFDRPLRVAVWGDSWGASVDAFADLCARVVGLEREFFDDRERPPYLISLLPIDVPAGTSFLGGTGLHDAFALFMPPGADLARGPERGMSVPWLLAHEMFHEWNGNAIRLDEPEGLATWFSEGFTDFYARRLLQRGGLLDEAAWLASWNARLTEYARHPQRNAPATRIQEAFWSDPDVQSLPYVRGDVSALRLDHALRQASADARSLDDWMRDLARRARAGGPPLSIDALLAEIEALAGPEAARALRAVNVDGADLALPVDALGPRYRLVEAQIPTFELGFDLVRSRAEGRVRGLIEGSAAARAGLREGDAVRGWSLVQGRTDVPVVLTLSGEGGAERSVSFLPLGKPARGWIVERTADPSGPGSRD